MMGKSLTMIGTALSLALTANIAVAESSKSPIAQSSSDSSTSAPTEIKMSPEGMKILCQNFPLNSRCAGGTAVTPSAPGSTTVPAETTPSDTTTPDSTTTPEGVTPPEDAPSNLTPAPGSVTPPEGAPSNLTPAPGSVTPRNLTPAPGSVTPPEGAPGSTTEPGLSPSTPGSSSPNTPATGN
ncbi:hypothetical protein [Nostoc sp. CALU 546]|uniref:hypothetical protein n=1 Tax=Nostoc sp. CALU 546 TaxID=1867241 RepID=UPI003B682B30